MTSPQLTPNSMIKNLKTTPLRPGTKQGFQMHHSYSAEVWKSQPEQLGKKKSNQIGKEEVKLSIFADDKTLKAPPETIRNKKMQ